MLGNKKLPLIKLFAESWNFCKINWKSSVAFTLIAFVIGCGILMAWKTLWLWPILLMTYILWGVLFRYYLKRKPLFDIKSLFNSLVPSTKIVVISLIVATLLIVLPIIPLFININPKFNLAYSGFLQGDFEQGNCLLLVADFVFVLMSPLLVYRPFLAWISALAGRSGSLRFAWARTKGNYIEFLVLAIVTNLGVVGAQWIIQQFGGNNYYLVMLLVAPMVIYFNVILVKTYEFFFLEIDD